MNTFTINFNVQNMVKWNWKRIYILLFWYSVLYNFHVSHWCIVLPRPSNFSISILLLGLPDGSVVKNPPANEADKGSISGLKDPLEKEMATHCSILAWEIPWTEEPGRLQSSSAQSLSRVQLLATPWTSACQASLSITNSQSLLKCMSIE